MQIDINIEDIVSDAVAAALSPEKLQPIVQKNMDEAVKRAIEEQFGYRSAFKTLLETKIAEAMPTDFEGMGRFSDLVLKTIQGTLNGMQQDVIAQALEPKLKQMLRPLPASMKLSELLKMLMKDFAESYARNDAYRPLIIAEKSEGNLTDGYWDLYLDPDAGKRDGYAFSKYQCAFHLRFRGDGECWGLKMNDEETHKKLMIGPCFNADALLLQLYTGGIKVEYEDIEPDDFYYEDSAD